MNQEDVDQARDFIERVFSHRRAFEDAGLAVIYGRLSNRDKTALRDGRAALEQRVSAAETGWATLVKKIHRTAAIPTVPALSLAARSWHELVLELIDIIAIAAYQAARDIDGSDTDDFALAEGLPGLRPTYAPMPEGMTKYAARYLPAIACALPAPVDGPAGEAIFWQVKHGMDSELPETATEAEKKAHQRLDLAWSDALVALHAVRRFAKPAAPLCLKPEQSLIMRVLLDSHPVALVQIDIAERARLNRDTVSDHLKTLREIMQLVHRPFGDRGGEALTCSGLELAKTLKPK